MTTDVPALPFALTDRGPSLTTLIAVETRKGVDTRAARALLASIAATGALLTTLAVVFGDADGATFGGFVTSGLAPVALLLPIVGVLVATSDWSQRSVVTTFALVPVRHRVLVAKVIAALLLVVGVVLVVVVIAFGAYVLCSMLQGFEANFADAPGAVRFWLATAAAATLTGVTFGSLLLSTPVAVTVVLVVPLGYDFLIAIRFPAVAEWISSGTWVLWLTGEPSKPLPVLTSLTMWVVVPLVAALWRQSRREVR